MTPTKAYPSAWGAAWFSVIALGAAAVSGCPDDAGTTPATATPSASAATAGAAAGATVVGGAGAGTTAGTQAAAGAAGPAGSAAAGAPSEDLAPNKCGAPSSLPPAELHAAAATVLLPTAMNARCAFSSCHSASGKRAGLVLEGETSDLHMLLVDKKPCEAPNLKLVDASGGDAALVNSWVWQKLVAPADAGGDVTANAAWGAPGSCGQSATGTYGQRMPASNPAGLAKESLDKVRAWICAGAPGR